MNALRRIATTCAFAWFATSAAHAACPNFTVVSDVTANAFPGTTLGIVAADFNGDSNVDLVATTDRNSLSWFAGAGNGTVVSEERYPTGAMPAAVSAGDFNGDQKLDLVTVNTYSNSISIHLGNGDGTFAAPRNIIVGMNPAAVAVGFFNADTNADLAVANVMTNDVSILTGNGDGTFNPAASFGAGTSPFSIVTGDFNGDDKADLAVANYEANGISILLGDGNATFGAPQAFSAGPGPRSIVAGDFNRDGKADLATVNESSNNASIFPGNGDGTFAAAVNVSVGTSPQSIATGDFNGDGRSDLVTANFGSNDVSVLLGNGDGTFASALSFAAGTGITSVAVADMDGNGRQDIIVGNASTDVAAVLLNTSDCATFTSIAPAAGPAAGGQSVVLTGMNLTSTTAVTFGGISATFTVDSATQITAMTPAHAPGLVDVQLMWSGGAAISPVGYTFVAAPTIDSITPDEGPLGGGQTVIITGTNFTGATSVTFGGTPATSFTVESAMQITAVNPAHVAGAVSVDVTTTGGTASGTYTYVAAPSISSLSPNTGPLGGGQTVTITGTDLSGTTSVTFDGIAATSFTVDSATQITATTPAHAAGPVDVVVTTPGGPVASFGGYTYVPAPSIGGISPTAGPLGGGQTVTINGSNFTGATSVAFGGAAASFTVDSPTQITAITPAHAPGVVDVVVATPGGSATTPAAYGFLAASAIPFLSMGMLIGLAAVLAGLAAIKLRG